MHSQKTKEENKKKNEKKFTARSYYVLESNNKQLCIIAII